jgi:Domain of unknown function (DUF4331)
MVKMKKILAAVAVALLAGAIGWVGVLASDHDDGETDKKSRSLNLTDLYVFRENDQDTGAGAGNLVFVMGSNPRSVARQQYYFSTNARYEFHLTQRMNNSAPVSGADDVTLRFEFGAPDASNQQAMTVTAIRNGSTLSSSTKVGGGPILTTPLASAGTPVSNNVELGGATLRVFAGLREDPFFFDVEQYFKIRASWRAAFPGNGSVGPRSLDTAVDFAKGYNVNAIVVCVPISFLANGTGATTFDVWETISVPQ